MSSPSPSAFHRLKAEVMDLFTDGKGVTEDYIASSRLRSAVHFCVIVVRGFLWNRCPIRAAALAYTTVLALVPMLVVVFSVSAAFAQKESDGLRNWVDKFIEQSVPQLKQMKEVGPDGVEVETYQKVLDWLFSRLESIQAGGLGISAAVLLTFVTISLLSTIEGTLNDMWGVKSGRSWAARIVQYWAAITLGPMVLLAAAGATSLNQLPFFQAFLAQIGRHLSWLVQTSTAVLIPLLFLSTALGVFYLLMPNTKVHWKAAMVGGLVAGFLAWLNNQLSIQYSSRVLRDQSLYGSVAAIPLILFGMYISWLIVLLGAQVSYAYQNRRAYLREKQAENVNEHGRERIALRLMTRIGERFERGGRPPSAHEMAEAMRLSRQLVGHILNSLVKAGLLTEVAGRDTGYTPARPLARITAHDILHALRSGEGVELPEDNDAAQEVVRAEFERIHSLEREAATAVTLQTLVDRAGRQNGARPTA